MFLNDIDPSEQFQARRLPRARIHPIPQPHIRNPLGHAVHMVSVECLGDIQVGDHVSPLDTSLILPLTSDFTDLCCRSCGRPWERVGWLGRILHNLTELIQADAYESNKWFILRQLPQSSQKQDKGNVGTWEAQSSHWWLCLCTPNPDRKIIVNSSEWKNKCGASLPAFLKERYKY